MANDADVIHRLAVADRLRVAAGVIDDAAAGRVDKRAALARVVDVLSIIVRQLLTELIHGNHAPAGTGNHPND